MHRVHTEKRRVPQGQAKICETYDENLFRVLFSTHPQFFPFIFSSAFSGPTIFFRKYKLFSLKFGNLPTFPQKIHIYLFLDPLAPVQGEGNVLVESTQHRGSLQIAIYIPAKCPDGLLKFYRGFIPKNSHRNRLFFTGVQCKGYFCRSLIMTGDADIMTGDPRW